MINKRSMVSLYGIILSLTLGGCTTLTSTSPKQLSYSTNGKIEKATLHCTGVAYCQFDRIDTIQLVEPESDWITAEALSSGMVKVTQPKLKHERLKFDLTLTAKQHEVSVKFYPISQYRAEKFTLIHQFKAGQDYTLVMYRQRLKQGSLLEVAMPDPLCVDLKQGKQIIRKFCREHDAVSGSGEFIEQDINLNES